MKNLTYFLCFFLPLSLFSQLDTMVVYDLATQTLEVIPPIDFNPAATFDKTGSNPGTLPGLVELSTQPPTTNLFMGAEFTTIAPAAEFFDITAYPVRTTVKLNMFKDGQSVGDCSGILVSENMVLTSTYCVLKTDTSLWAADNVEVHPAYDEGMAQPNLPSTVVDKFIVFKEAYDADGLNNLALIKLAEPIGSSLGWTGIAFAEDSFFEDNVMHKFSYPSSNPFGPLPEVNGDTMYYNYGLTDVIFNGNLGLEGSDARGLPGQLGSTFLYTDGQDYYNFGTLFWSNIYHHERILPRYFYQLKNAMESFEVSPVSPEPAAEIDVKIFPNPFDQMALIQFSNPSNQEYHFQLFNASGQLVSSETGKGTQITVERNNLPVGTYFFQLVGLGGEPVNGKIVAQ